MGSTTESSYFQATHNPWNLDRVPEAPPAAVPLLSRPAKLSGLWVQIPAVPFVSLLLLTAVSVSNRPMAVFPVTAAWLLRLRSTRSGRSPATLPMPLQCSILSAARTSMILLRCRWKCLTLPKLCVRTLKACVSVCRKNITAEGLDPKVHAELKKAIAQYEAMALRSLRFPCLIPNMRSLPITSLLRQRLPPIWPVMTASGTVSVRLMPPARPK